MTVPPDSRRRPVPPWPIIATCGALAAAAIWWAAAPLHGGGRGTRIAFITAIAAGLLSVTQLAVAAWSRRGGEPGWRQPAGRLPSLLWAAPWPEVLLVAVLALEALHPARPWHTGVLGVVVMGFLLAAHLAETSARPSVLTAQLPVLAAGLGLLALAVAAAALPALSAGPAATAVRTAAIGAAVIAGALAVPVGGGRRP